MSPALRRGRIGMHRPARRQPPREQPAARMPGAWRGCGRGHPEVEKSPAPVPRLTGTRAGVTDADEEVGDLAQLGGTAPLHRPRRHRVPTKPAPGAPASDPFAVAGIHEFYSESSAVSNDLIGAAQPGDDRVDPLSRCALKHKASRGLHHSRDYPGTYARDNGGRPPAQRPENAGR